jgi:hypothetical protein
MKKKRKKKRKKKMRIYFYLFIFIYLFLFIYFYLFIFIYLFYFTELGVAIDSTGTLLVAVGGDKLVKCTFIFILFFIDCVSLFCFFFHSV